MHHLYYQPTFLRSSLCEFLIPGIIQLFHEANNLTQKNITKSAGTVKYRFMLLDKSKHFLVNNVLVI